MNICDPEKTAKVVELLKVFADYRDQTWLMSFFRNVVEAQFWGNTAKVLDGEDGFPYIALFTEPREDTPEKLSIADVLPLATENGFGIALNPHKIKPDWLFTYGQMWSLREFGSLHVQEAEPNVVPVEIDESQERGIYVGEPTEAYFPPYARLVLKHFFQHILKRENTKVMVIIDPSSKPENALTFSFFPEDFPSEKEFETALHMIDWHLPPHYGFRGVPKDSKLAENFKLF